MLQITKTEHGFVYYGRVGMPLVHRSREDYINESFVSSLDDTTLNALDKYRAKRDYKATSFTPI